MVEQKLAFAHASFQGACKLRLPDFTRPLTPEIIKVIFFPRNEEFWQTKKIEHKFVNLSLVPKYEFSDGNHRRCLRQLFTFRAFYAREFLRLFITTLIITITISSSAIGASAASFFTNHSVQL